MEDCDLRLRLDDSVGFLDTNSPADAICPGASRNSNLHCDGLQLLEEPESFQQLYLSTWLHNESPIAADSNSDHSLSTDLQRAAAVQEADLAEQAIVFVSGHNR